MWLNSPSLSPDRMVCPFSEHRSTAPTAYASCQLFWSSLSDWREHRVAILAALALLDPQHHALGVDVGHLQGRNLGHAQARTIGHAQRRLVFDARGGLQKTHHLLVAQH